jgi:predicted transglutaminase-like cysteine proteinase
MRPDARGFAAGGGDAMLGRLLMALFAAAGIATAQASPKLANRSAAPPLPAWVTFCDRHADECRIDRSEPETVLLTGEVLELLRAVNAYVNRTIAPRLDIEHWQQVDRWDLPSDGQGDCEDYQLLKRKLLAEAGLPRRAMRMTVVIDEIGEGHAVLTVRTATDDLILDNKTDAVLPWHEVGYRFIKRESADAVAWLFVEPDGAAPDFGAQVAMANQEGAASRPTP